MSMELDHSFTVPVPPDRAWEVLLDVERIAPCMPGATVEEFDGEVVTGRIKVKVGPVSLTYRGTAKFTERDPGTRAVVVDASGKETRGAGTASAAIRASLVPSGEGTEVSIHTTMNVTGRPAQFGRGVIAEVGGKLVEKFAENLAQMISDGGVGADAADVGLAVAGRTLAWPARGRRPAARKAPETAARRPVPRWPLTPGRPRRNQSPPSPRRRYGRRRRHLRRRTRTPSTWSGWSVPRSSSGSFRSPSGSRRWCCWADIGGIVSTVVRAARRPDKGWTDRDEARWPVPFWQIDTGMAALLILLTAWAR
jgi:carbon monoxide dehydrogenase subunit G